MLVNVDIKQNKIDLLLAALKVAESSFTQMGKWDNASDVGKLHAELRKQIFEYHVEFDKRVA